MYTEVAFRMKKSVVLCILDGWGHAPSSPNNAIDSAVTWKRLWQQYPHTLLDASGEAVGLPTGQMGNSEVGHTTIGLGRVVEQDLPRMHRLIRENAWNLPQSGRCHLVILASSGGVHSHIDHLLAAIQGMPHVELYLHLFLDGRDTPPKEALHTLKDLNTHHTRWGTIGGRYYGMDRDKRWDRIEKAARAMLYAEAPVFDDPIDYIQSCYDQNITDEFIEPAAHRGYQGFQPGDHVLILNFRADRVRQIIRVLHTFECGDRKLKPVEHLSIQGLVDYGYPIPSLLPKPVHDQSVGQVVSQAGLTQARIAETEKYAHITFFLNGGKEEVFSGEKRYLIPSPPVATYDLKPEMSANEVLDATLDAIKNGVNFIAVNFANADMVGHTGSIKAAQQAVEAVDACLLSLEKAMLDHGIELLITADHGNAEVMIDSQEHCHTAHTCNPVPFVWISQTPPNKLRESGTLIDIAPTILNILQLEKPQAMTGKDLRL